MTTPYVTSGGADVLAPRLAPIHALTEQIFTDARRQVQDENATVWIENASGNPSASGAVSAFLNSNYVHVAGASTLPTASAKSAVIDTTGTLTVTRTLMGRWFNMDPTSNQVRVDTTQTAPSGAEMIVVIGTDFAGFAN